MRQDRTELRNKIYAIIQEKKQITGSGIREALGMPLGAETSNAINTAIKPLTDNGLVSYHGRSKGYSTNEVTPGTTKPVKPTLPEASKAAIVHMIEIPRATLKVLVQAHIEADTPMEGAFGKAMLCALKKLI
jgi:biotin operon repressor